MWRWSSDDVSLRFTAYGGLAIWRTLAFFNGVRQCAYDLCRTHLRASEDCSLFGACRSCHRYPWRPNGGCTTSHLCLWVLNLIWLSTFVDWVQTRVGVGRAKPCLNFRPAGFKGPNGRKYYCLKYFLNIKPSKIFLIYF